MQYIAIDWFHVKGEPRVVRPGETIECTATRVKKQLAAGMVVPAERAPELAARVPRERAVLSRGENAAKR
jgi:hypothetical protein